MHYFLENIGVILHAQSNVSDVKMALVVFSLFSSPDHCHYDKSILHSDSFAYLEDIISSAFIPFVFVLFAVIVFLYDRDFLALSIYIIFIAL